MKKLLLFLFVLVFLNVHSQEVYKWTEEQIITDTVNDYSNPFVYPFWSDAWMFYQKDGDNSSIMKMNLTVDEGTITLLENSGVNYSQPMFISTFNPNYLGYLFYLSDQNGYKQLIASKYYENDSLGEQITLATHNGSFDIDDYMVLNEGLISYTSNTKVYAGELRFLMDSVYTFRIRKLDSAASNIHIRYYQSAWEKTEGNETHIYLSDYKYNADTADKVWSSQYYADSVGNSEGLNLLSSIAGWGENGFCWINNNTFKVLSGGSNYQHTDTISTFNMSDIRQPTMISWDIAVRETFFLPHYSAFTTGQGDSSEIFCSMGDYGYEDSAFISNNNHNDYNPQLFYGESVDGWGTEAYYSYCIWQSDINGHNVLSSSKAMVFIGSDIEENQEVGNYLEVFPNPVHDKANVKVNSYSGEANLRIFDMQGKTVFYQTGIKTNNNWNNFVWTPDADLKNSSYIISLELGAKKYTRKILLVR